jgi:hypothetical protein
MYVGFEVPSGGYEEYYLLGYNAVKCVESRRCIGGTSSPYSGSNKPSKILVAYMLVSYAASSTLKMEAICSFETLVDYTALYPRK